MPSRPMIDRPCPLDPESQLRVGDFCSRCAHPVHQLDAMDPAERERLRRSSSPICVSYRLAIGMSAALALSMNPAQAIPKDEVLPQLPSHQQPERSLLDSAIDAVHAPMSPVSEPAEEVECEETLEFIIVGGVSDPSTAEWIEQDRSLPALPVRRVDAPET